MTANTTSNATTEGMITFNGLKLAGAATAAAGAIGVADWIGTVTAARRGVTGAGGGGSCLALTTVSSSGSSLPTVAVEAVLTVGCTGTGANCAVPDAIVRSSIISPRF